MSTSANAPGEPGRDRDDDAADPDGADEQPQTDGGAAPGKNADDDGGKPESKGGADDGAAIGSGRDVTKKVRQEARKSEAAARKPGKDVKGSERKSTSSSGVPGREGKDLGFFARIALFVRQVIAEIRKVVTPSRNELVTFSVVVIVFILAMMAYVGVLDFAFGRLVLWVFGN